MNPFVLDIDFGDDDTTMYRLAIDDVEASLTAYYETVHDGRVWNKRIKEILNYHRRYAEERIKVIKNNRK